MPDVRDEFTVHKLNPTGMQKAVDLARQFSKLLDEVEASSGSDGRDIALVKTHLQLASFYAKRAMATRKENQE